MNRRGAHFLTLVFILAATVLTFTAEAQDEIPYTFAGSHFPLILEQDNDNRLHGLAVDILSEIAAEAGVTINIEFLPWGRALKRVKEGRVDGIIGLYKSEERKSFLQYSDNHFREDQLMVMARSNVRLKWDGNFSSLEDVEIITIKHWAYGEKFNAAKDTLKTHTANNLNQGLGMLMKGRGEVIIANRQSALYEMKKMSIMSNVRFLNPAFHTVRNYFAFSKIKNDTAFQKKFNTAFQKLRKSGKLASFSARHTLIHDMTSMDQ
jgi:polar amino acid transport system substrate-binding protein